MNDRWLLRAYFWVLKPIPDIKNSVVIDVFSGGLLHDQIQAIFEALVRHAWLSCALTFEITGMTRLAGACPVD